MPRKANVTVDEAVQSLKKFIFHFSSPQLPRYSDPVWTEISKDLNCKWTPHNLYNKVVADCWGILTRARLEKGITIPSPTNQLSPKSDNVTSNDSSTASTDSDETDIGPSNNNELFAVQLTSEEWKAIKPISSSGGEKLVALRKGVWTNVVAMAISRQTKLPCAYVFKRAKVSTATTCTSKFVTMYGQCNAKSCGNELIAYIEEEPPEDADVTMNVLTNDTRNDESHEVAKRPLNGTYRKDVQKDLVYEGASNFRKRKAREEMALGDAEPPYLPNAAVLRQAKKQRMDEDLGLDAVKNINLISSIEEIADRPEFSGTIHYIASRPLVVVYSTPSQLHAYKEYCKKTMNSTLIIDATGSLVKKPIRDSKTRCGPIFLYSMVINFDHMTIPVHQMLSEKHDAHSIMTWIHLFMRTGAPKPRRAISDYSRALLYAMCQEFNGMTLKKYIHKCFKKLSANKPVVVPTHIRIDVAHILHFISMWKCWKTVAHIEVKQFFLRCMGLMIQASDMKYLETVLTYTATVAANKYLDSVVKVSTEFDKPDDLSQSSNTVLNIRNNLEKFIANKGADMKNMELRTAADNDHLRPIDDHCEYISNECDGGKIQDIVQWVDKIFATATAIELQGREMNAFYVPGFVPLLRNLAVEFPIWTNCSTPENDGCASSAAIESYFNDLKTNVLKKGLRRADNFLVTHLRDIEGGCLLFVAKTARYKNEKQASEEVNLHNVSSFCEINSQDTGSSHIDPDVWSIENWGNQVPKTEFLNPSTSDNEEAGDEVLGTVDSTWDHSYSRIEEEPDQREIGAITEASNVQCTNVLYNDNIKPKGTYLRSFPEIRYVNSRLDEQPSKSRRKMKECFLQNGSQLQQPVKIDGKFYFVVNTCAFDSVVQILLSGAVDHPCYDLAIQNSTNAILQFVARTLTTGGTKKTYADRARLLLERYTAEPKVQTKSNTLSYIVNATDSLYNFINLAMKEEPSLYVIEECNRSCRREYPLVLLSPNHKMIQKSGFGVLEKALNMWPCLTKLPCFSKDCPGSMTRTNRPGIHLFIDADVRVSTTDSHGVPCNLGNLPAVLKLEDHQGNDLQYRLIGAVAYTPNHFIGYSYRNMMKWERSDDMGLETKRESNKAEIVPHLITYVRTSDM